MRFLVLLLSSSVKPFLFAYFEHMEGTKNNEIADAMAIVESPMVGNKSFHNKPLVIHAITVMIKIIATIFSSLLRFPSSFSFFVITSRSPIIDLISVILDPNLIIYNHATMREIPPIGNPINIHWAKVTSVPVTSLAKDANIALAGVLINVVTPLILAAYATESNRH